MPSRDPPTSSPPGRTATMDATGLAAHHQLHGLQPVLPVADVESAAAWFRDLLGFEIEFLWGDPPSHGRVRLGVAGSAGWGQPIFIHVGRSAMPIVACGELRIHVGYGLDALHERCCAHGARILAAPADQPWGLREFLLATPDGHRLRLCAEVT